MKKAIIIPVVLIITLTLFAGFDGTYEVEGPDYYAELSIEFQPGNEQGYYKLERNLGTPGDVYFGAGIEAFGFLAAAQLDQDYLAVYTMLDSELSGLIVPMDPENAEDIYSESVEGATLLELSPPRISGVYAVGCENNYSEAVAAYTMILEPSGNVLKVTRVEESQETYPGVGIIIGDVLITGVLIGDTKEVSILKIKDDELYGDWLGFSCGDEEFVSGGIMRATTIKAEG
jgi:hypothetical protein